jgi:hypothetical protein
MGCETSVQVRCRLGQEFGAGWDQMFGADWDLIAGCDRRGEECWRGHGWRG